MLKPSYLNVKNVCFWERKCVCMCAWVVCVYIWVYTYLCVCVSMWVILWVGEMGVGVYICIYTYAGIYFFLQVIVSILVAKRTLTIIRLPLVRQVYMDYLKRFVNFVLNFSYSICLLYSLWNFIQDHSAYTSIPTMQDIVEHNIDQFMYLFAIPSTHPHKFQHIWDIHAKKLLFSLSDQLFYADSNIDISHHPRICKPVALSSSSSSSQLHWIYPNYLRKVWGQRHIR